jgi:pyruvate/2-oxoglutarate dehydrogenase complex dihydrolipoamide acyltransferase (E2) component
MYGLTRATVTLIAAAVAGFLIWIATQVGTDTNGEYWATYGLIAGAGLTMALSQLLGGWTKWGWPRVSINVFLWAFVPTAIAVLWVVCFHQPDGNWFKDHVRDWSDDIGLQDFVNDFTDYVGVFAFGLGLVFGFTFDTTGPATEPFWRRRRAAAAATPAPTAAPRDRDRAEEEPRRERAAEEEEEAPSRWAFWRRRRRRAAAPVPAAPAPSEPAPEEEETRAADEAPPAEPPPRETAATRDEE